MLEDRFGSARAALPAALIGEIDVEPKSGANLVSQALPGVEGFKVRYRKDASRWQAPEYCAILAALRKSASRTIAGFTTAKEPTELQRNWASRRLTRTVSSARHEIQAKLKQHPDWSPSDFIEVYWFLRIFDDSWVRALVRATQHKAIPSKDSDRLLLRQKVRRDNTGAVHWPAAAASRARARDSAWFSKLRKMSSNASFVHRSESFARERQALETELLVALAREIQNERRPMFVSAKTIAQTSGVSVDKVRAIKQLGGPFQRAMNFVNADTDRRRLIWALDKLQGNSTPISIRSIQKIFRLTLSNEMVNLAAEMVWDLFGIRLNISVTEVSN
jgi:hypothetical protein